MLAQKDEIVTVKVKQWTAHTIALGFPGVEPKEELHSVPVDEIGTQKNVAASIEKGVPAGTLANADVLKRQLNWVFSEALGRVPRAGAVDSGQIVWG